MHATNPSAAAASNATRAPEALLSALADLPALEVLALCYGRNRPDSEKVHYIGALRRSQDHMAAASALIICFDLAEREFPGAQREFETLAATLMGSPRDIDVVDQHIGDDGVLGPLWRRARSALGAGDPRVESLAIDTLAADADVIELDLLDILDDDEDALDIDVADVLDVTDVALEQTWRAAQDRFMARARSPERLPSHQTHPERVLLGGFIAERADDLERLDRFRQSADSLARDVPGAKRMVPMVELYMASHLRARNVFGQPNPMRDALMRQGLAHFTALEGPPSEAAAWMTEPTAEPYAWEKTAELLLDYCAHLAHRVYERAQTGAGPIAHDRLAHDYVAAGRPQPPPQVLAPGGERRRRVPPRGAR